MTIATKHVAAHEINLLFFEETNSDCNVSLILTSLFKELQEYKNVQLLHAVQLHGQVANSSTQQTVNSQQTAAPWIPDLNLDHY